MNIILNLSKKILFLIAGQKVHFIARFGTIVHCATRENKCFSRVAHDFFSTIGSKSGFVCPARGNKVHFMSR